MTAELQARRTAAAAVAADFEREMREFTGDDSLTLPTPDYMFWANRLCLHLHLVLDQLDAEDPA